MKKAEASRKTKSSTSKRAGLKGSTPAGGQEVTIDRRRAHIRHGEVGAAAEKSPVVAPQLERRKKVNRRRQIDPTTCERDYTDGEIEFMNALDEYKRKSGRMFPTCSEVLEVVRTLGYVKLSAADFAAAQGANSSSASGSAPAKWFASDAECAEKQDDEEAIFEGCSPIRSGVITPFPDPYPPDEGLGEG